MFLQILFISAFAYLLGSIPTGKIVGNLYGVDIQKQGSGNIGFANAVRVLGRKSGLIVLIGDTLKGFIPVMIAKHYLGGYQLAIVGLAAILGHIFPVWLKFRGGKGIATGLGITLAISPLLGSLGLIVYILVIIFARKSALASVVSAWSLPLFCLSTLPSYALFYLGLALLATWTHRTNIKHMLSHKIAYDD